MRRRTFLALAGAVAAAPAWPLAGLAQQATKVPRIVVFSNGIRDDQKQAIFQGLADFGYADGKNVMVEFLTAPTIDDVPSFAAMAIALKPDIIWTLSSAPPLAVKALTTTIPVVFTSLQDPVAIGAVVDYAHPGGNLTGNMLAGIDFAGKQIDIIRAVLPNVTRLALLGLPADPPYHALSGQVQAAAKALNIETLLIETKEGDDFVPLFDRATALGAQAIYVITAQYFTTSAPTIADLALRYKLAAFGGTLAATSGYLVGYGSDTLDVTRRSASYIDAILKGAKPRDLPVDQPTAFQLILNTKTAKALGITIPETVLVEATQVI